MTEDEQHLVRGVRITARLASQVAGPAAAGWRYSSAAALLLGCGRLFTPGEPPAQLGQAQRCWSNATWCAEDTAAVYVEGLAALPGMAALGMETPHAWCALGDTAIDPSPGWEGAAYFGVPLTDAYRLELQRRHGIGPLFFGDWVVDLDLLRHGLPVGAVAEVGRRLPALAD